MTGVSRGERGNRHLGEADAPRREHHEPVDLRPNLPGGRRHVALAEAPAGGGHEAGGRRWATQLPALSEVYMGAYTFRLSL